MRMGRNLREGDVLVVWGTGGIERQDRCIVGFEAAARGRIAKLDDTRPGPAEALIVNDKLYRVMADGR